MRITLILLSIVACLSISCKSSQSVIAIPANQSVEIDYPGIGYTATINNSGSKNIDVSVVSKSSDQQVKGFGLGTFGTAEVDVAPDNKLKFTNNGSKKGSLKLNIENYTPTSKSTAAPTAAKRKYVSFTLENMTAKSIPLIIPKVMNPNLSPFSKSGVDLAIGQEIYFKAKRKKRLLLTVSDEIKNGDILNVEYLIKKRRAELGI